MVGFRKSKKVGPFRFTLSKRGISTSAGAGPLRFSRGADGKYRRTVRLPGTGLYDTRVVGGGQAQRAGAAPRLAPDAGWYADPAGGPGSKYWDGTLWHDAVPAYPGVPIGARRGGSARVWVAVAAVLLGLVGIGKLTESRDHDTATSAPSVSSTAARPPVADPEVDITARGSFIVPGVQFPPGSTGSASADGSAEVWKTPLVSGALVDVMRDQLPVGASMGALPWCTEQARDPLTQQVIWMWGGYPEPMVLVAVTPGRGEVSVSRGTHPADVC